MKNFLSGNAKRPKMNGFSLEIFRGRSIREKRGNSAPLQSTPDLFGQDKRKRELHAKKEIEQAVSDYFSEKKRSFPVLPLPTLHSMHD